MSEALINVSAHCVFMERIQRSQSVGHRAGLRRQEPGRTQGRKQAVRIQCGRCPTLDTLPPKTGARVGTCRHLANNGQRRREAGGKATLASRAAFRLLGSFVFSTDKPNTAGPRRQHGFCSKPPRKGRSQ